MAAARFVHAARENMRTEAASAIRCFQSGSALGVRQNLELLSRQVERRARIERNLLNIPTRTRPLKRAVSAAFDALGRGAFVRLGRVLDRVEALTRSDGH